MESELKRLVAEDVKNPEIYNKIFELSKSFIIRGKYVSNFTNVVDIATIIAEELYLKIYNGGKIDYWVAYIGKTMPAYIRIWKKLYGSEIIDTEDNFEMSNAILSMSFSNNNNYSSVTDYDFINYLPNIINNVLNEIKYYKDTKPYLNIRLSLLLSFIKGDFVSYNLSDIESSYARFVFSVVKEIIKDNLRENNVIDNDLGELSILQLYTLENSKDCD